MSTFDKEIDLLEKQIPNLAISATKKAYKNTLSKGLSVLIAEDGKLKEVFPGGSKMVLKIIEPDVRVVFRKSISVKWK